MQGARELTDVISKTIVNAKTSTKLGTVKVAMDRGFRFGSRAAEAVAA